MDVVNVHAPSGLNDWQHIKLLTNLLQSSSQATLGANIGNGHFVIAADMNTSRLKMSQVLQTCRDNGSLHTTTRIHECTGAQPAAEIPCVECSRWPPVLLESKPTIKNTGSSAPPPHGFSTLLQSTAQDLSYPPAAATEHGLSAMLAEDILEVVIPFLTIEPPGLTMCDPKEGRTPLLTTGEHMHVWCERCANFETPCAATHDACPDCMILRTMMQLSRRWFDFMWDYRKDHCMYSDLWDGSF